MDKIKNSLSTVIPKVTNKTAIKTHARSFVRFFEHIHIREFGQKYQVRQRKQLHRNESENYVQTINVWRLLSYMKSCNWYLFYNRMFPEKAFCSVTAATTMAAILSQTILPAGYIKNRTNPNQRMIAKGMG